MYRFRQSDSERINDIYQGRVYKEHFQPGKFLGNPHNISVTGTTDGVALISLPRLVFGPSTWSLMNYHQRKGKYNVDYCV